MGGDSDDHGRWERADVGGNKCLVPVVRGCLTIRRGNGDRDTRLLAYKKNNETKR